MCQSQTDRQREGETRRSLSIILAHSSVSIDSMRYNIIVVCIWYMLICKAHWLTIPTDSSRRDALTRTKT